jgi:hypothetical protein
MVVMFFLKIRYDYALIIQNEKKNTFFFNEIL